MEVEGTVLTAEQLGNTGQETEIHKVNTGASNKNFNINAESQFHSNTSETEPTLSGSQIPPQGNFEGQKNKNDSEAPEWVDGDHRLNEAPSRPFKMGNKLKPPAYDGTCSWPDYLIQFNMISELNKWDEHEKLLYLGASLDGVAREVLDINPNSLGRFVDLVKCLSKRFGSEEQEEIFRAWLKNRTQEPDESFPDLAHSIRRLVKNAYPEAPYKMLESMSKDHFIDAIDNVEVQNLVYYKEPDSLEEAVRLAIKISSRIQGQKKLSRKPIRSIQSGYKNMLAPLKNTYKGYIENETEVMPILQKLQDQITKLSIQNQKKLCYRCGSENHLVNMCPKPHRTCFRCGSSNHLVNRCLRDSRPDQENYMF